MSTTENTTPRYVAAGEDVQDTSTGLVARFVDAAAAGEAAVWMNDPASKPEEYIWGAAK